MHIKASLEVSIALPYFLPYIFPLCGSVKAHSCASRTPFEDQASCEKVVSEPPEKMVGLCRSRVIDMQQQPGLWLDHPDSSNTQTRGVR